jgi:DNA-binding NarL/FixJ family response regulator
MIDVVLVDDHDVVRRGLRAVLERDGGFRVMADAGSVVDALRACGPQQQPQVVVMDLSIPGCDGIDGTREVLRNWPRSRVLVLSAYQDDQLVIGAIKAGARGFVVKRASSEKLFEALKTVAAGGVYLSSEVSHCLFETVSGGSAPQVPATQLTPREGQILRMIADGKTSKEIASSIHLSPETVRSHRKTLMRKLGVHNVAGLTQVALKEGLIRRY